MCACVWVNIETVCHGNIRSNSPESLARWCVCVQVCVCVGGGGGGGVHLLASEGDVCHILS